MQTTKLAVIIGAALSCLHARGAASTTTLPFFVKDGGQTYIYTTLPNGELIAGSKSNINTIQGTKWHYQSTANKHLNKWDDCDFYDIFNKSSYKTWGRLLKSITSTQAWHTKKFIQTFLKGTQLKQPDNLLENLITHITKAGHLGFIPWYQKMGGYTPAASPKEAGKWSLSNPALQFINIKTGSVIEDILNSIKPKNSINWNDIGIVISNNTNLGSTLNLLSESAGLNKAVERHFWDLIDNHTTKGELLSPVRNVIGLQFTFSMNIGSDHNGVPTSKAQLWIEQTRLGLILLSFYPIT